MAVAPYIIYGLVWTIERARLQTPPRTNMKNKTHSSLALIVLAMLIALAAPLFADPAPRDANALLDSVDDLYRGDSSQGRMSMTIVTENWTRNLETEMSSLGKDKSLVRILSPKKERGTATLRVDRDIWNYLPKVDRVIKLPSSMMSASWMGSHVTNNDLVRESRFSDDFTCEFAFDGERDGKLLIEIDCLPHEDAAVEWGKVSLNMDGETELPLEVRYFDEDMALARTIIYTEIRAVDGRDMPTKMIVTPTDKPEESTTVSWDEITFDVDIEESFFSLRQLKEQ